jgi:hypothetical protein
MLAYGSNVGFLSLFATLHRLKAACRYVLGEAGYCASYRNTKSRYDVGFHHYAIVYLTRLTMTLIYFSHALPYLDRLRPDYNCVGMLSTSITPLNPPYNDFDIL